MSGGDTGGGERERRSQKPDALDVNSPAFSPGRYVNSLIQRKGLDELVAVEEDMIKNVRRLDSEMQQLVYENYSKFISATNTVRNMQNTFAEMNDGLQGLSTRVHEISRLSNSLTEIFSENRENVRRAGKASSAVKQLRSIAELPNKLETLVGEGRREESVEAYLEVRRKFDKYRHIPSIASIYGDCEQKMEKLRDELHMTLKESGIAEQRIEGQVEAVQLLLKLGENEEDLRRELTAGWKRDFDREVGGLNDIMREKHCDLLEFVERYACTLLTAFSLAVSSFRCVFSDAESRQLIQFVRDYVSQVVRVLELRFESDENGGECALYVRALDKAVGKISSLSRLAPDLDFTPPISTMVLRAGERQVTHCREAVGARVDLVLAEIGQRLERGEIDASSLQSTTSDIEQAYIVAVKKCLANLLLFIALDTNFASIDQADFFEPFTQLVYSELVVGSLRDMAKRWKEAEQKQSASSGECRLVYAVALHNILTKHLVYLLALSREQFKLTSEQPQHFVDKPPDVVALAEDFKSAVQVSLHAYIRSEATRLVRTDQRGEVNQQIAGSKLKVSDTMKFCSRQIETVNGRLATLLDGHSPQDDTAASNKVREGSDLQRAEAASVASSGDSNSMASTTVVERLWSEADDAEGTSEERSFELRRQPLIIAIVQAFLTHLADERLGDSGEGISQDEMQQLQVDASFLKRYVLSRQIVTSGEQQLNSAVESFMNAALNRCAQPKLLEPAAVKRICDAALST